MINMNNEMNRLILFFTLKHKGNWEKIFYSIKTKDTVTNQEMEKVKSLYSKNYISLVDEKYPNNFKEIYMPPLSLFTIGEQSLLNQDNNIYSLWHIKDYHEIFKYASSANKIYALFYDDTQANTINELLKANYKLILIDHNGLKKKNLDNIVFNENIVYISEIPFEIEKPEMDQRQIFERVLLGISKYAILHFPDERYIQTLLPLFIGEHRNMFINGTDLGTKYQEIKFVKPFSVLKN